MKTSKKFGARVSPAAWVVALATSLAGGCGEWQPSSEQMPTAVQAMEGTGAALDPEELSGLFALKVVMTVRWPDTPKVTRGQGNIVQFARIRRQADRDGGQVGFHDTISVCGIEVPEQKVGDKLARLDFDHDAFGTDGIGTVTVKSALRENNGQMQVVSDWATFMLGGAMDNPSDESRWPTPQEFASRGDSEGLRANFFADNGDYAGPDFMGSRLTEVRVVTRNIEKVTSNVVVGSLSRLDGTVEVMRLSNGQWALQSSMVRAEYGNKRKLTGITLGVSDRMKPLYEVVDGDEGRQSATMIRIDEGTTCEQIRALNFD